MPCQCDTVCMDAKNKPCHEFLKSGSRSSSMACACFAAVASRTLRSIEGMVWGCCQDALRLCLCTRQLLYCQSSPPTAPGGVGEHSTWIAEYLLSYYLIDGKRAKGRRSTEVPSLPDKLACRAPVGRVICSYSDQATLTYSVYCHAHC